MHNVADEAEEIRIDDTRIFVYYEENHEENTRYRCVYIIMVMHFTMSAEIALCMSHLYIIIIECAVCK